MPSRTEGRGIAGLPGRLLSLGRKQSAVVQPACPPGYNQDQSSQIIVLRTTGSLFAKQSARTSAVARSTTIVVVRVVLEAVHEAPVLCNTLCRRANDKRVKVTSHSDTSEESNRYCHVRDCINCTPLSSDAWGDSAPLIYAHASLRSSRRLSTPLIVWALFYDDLSASSATT